MRTVILLAALGLTGAAYWFTQLHPEQIPPRLYGWVPGLGRIIANRLDAPSLKGHASAKKSVRARSSTLAAMPLFAKPVTLYLANGGAVTGDLVKETPEEVTLRWEYGQVGFLRSEIVRMVRGKEGTGADGMTIPWEGQAAAPANDSQ